MTRLSWVVLGLLFISQGLAGQSGVAVPTYIDVDGDSMWVGHYRAMPPAPDAPVVILVPGWPGSGTDVLGLGQGLSERGVHVFVFQPRGHGLSGGRAGFKSGLEDVGAVLDWLVSGSAPIPVTSREEVVLAGYSWGGGIALAFAAQDPSVRRVISIAGSDHGVFIRRFDGDPEYGAFYRGALMSTRAPEGPVRFDVDESLGELRTDWEHHDLATIAPQLQDREILLIAGWDDDQVEVEYQVMPFYRALRGSGATSVSIRAYHDRHAFRAVRSELLSDVYGWITGTPSPSR